MSVRSYVTEAGPCSAHERPQPWWALVTSDFLTGLMEKHEKMAWMLRAFVDA